MDEILNAMEKVNYWHSKPNAETILNAYGCDLHLAHERVEESAYSKIKSWKPEDTVFLGLMDEECNLTVDGVKELVKYLQEWLNIKNKV